MYRIRKILFLGSLGSLCLLLGCCAKAGGEGERNADSGTGRNPLSNACSSPDSPKESLLRGKTHHTNFVIIMTDDQGYADIGCYGAKGFKTPNLDKLASQGMRFTDFHVAQAVCTASRAALMTGCYPNRISLLGALFPLSKIGIHPEEETLAEILKKKGYATAIFGKWHLGHLKPFLPLQNGFDEYFGLPYSNDMWSFGYDGKKIPPEGSYNPLMLIDGNDKVREIRSMEDQAQLTELYTQRAIRFIQKNKDRPFFLFLPHSMPHTPLAVSNRFKGKSQQGLYGDVIMEIDWSVGQIMKTLKETDTEENTLMVFISDNGPWLCFGNHAGNAGPLREGKFCVWEGGTRVPCLIRWPQQIRPASVCDKMAATIDLLPTFAAIADAPLPVNKIDGSNILPLMKETEGAYPRHSFWYYFGKDLNAIRQDQWKLVFPHEYRSMEGMESGNDGQVGKYGKKITDLALFNLETDVGEIYDVKEQYPEIVERLQSMAEQAREDLGDSITGRKGANVRPSGNIETP